MPYGDIGNTMNKVSVGEPADGTFPYQGTYPEEPRICGVTKGYACAGRAQYQAIMPFDCLGGHL